jgi:hypothetical protein
MAIKEDINPHRGWFVTVQNPDKISDPSSVMLSDIDNGDLVVEGLRQDKVKRKIRELEFLDGGCFGEQQFKNIQVGDSGCEPREQDGYNGYNKTFKPE